MQWLRSGGRLPFRDRGLLFDDRPPSVGYRSCFQPLYQEPGYR